MAEKFTVYSFQLRPDDYTRFAGGFYDDAESYSEEEYSNVDENVFDIDGAKEDVFDIDGGDEDIFNVDGGIEKQNMTDMAADVDDAEIFDIGEEDIFNLETEL
jgi:hypothetical protein